MEVKEEAEEEFVRNLDKVLDETVFSAGCSNWYINKAGRNAAAWPGLAVTYWKQTFWPKWKDFEYSGGSITWPFYWLGRHLSIGSMAVGLAVVAAAVQSRDSEDTYAIARHLNKVLGGLRY